MFDKFIDMVWDVIGVFKCWEVLDEYQEGVVLTLGRPRPGWYNGWREPVVGPGFYWLLPLYIEQVTSANVMINSNIFASQTLQTSDGVQVTLKAACLWRINNIKTFLLKVDEGQTTVNDAVVCAIADMVRAATWAEINRPEWHQLLQANGHKAAVKHGLEVVKLTLVDLVRMDISARLYQN